MERQTMLAPFLAVALLVLSPGARADDADMKALRAANCKELAPEYKSTIEAEKELRESIKSTSRDNVATNVVGAAMLATLGVGFFSWSGAGDAKEQLEEVLEYKQALITVMGEKKCAKPDN